MIIIEHQTRFLFPLCDQVTVLNAGEVILTSTADVVRADPCPAYLSRRMTSEYRPALQVSALFAGYGRFDVVRDIAFRVGTGEAVALLGPNGAGKTTVLRAIMGMVKHRRGTIRVGDKDVSALPTYRIARGLRRSSLEGRRLFLDQSVERQTSCRAPCTAWGQAPTAGPARLRLWPVSRAEGNRPPVVSFLSGGEQQWSPSAAC